ncbi:MAG: hypothetical protein RLZZ58_1524 [Pseudomonadota bacterium]
MVCHARHRTNRSLLPLAVLTLAIVAVPAWAQDAAPPVAAESESETPITFAADTVTYANDDNIVVAEGNVQFERDANQLRADKVVWNRATGAVTATGNVAITNPAGDTAYGDAIDLSDSLRDGLVENMLVVLENGSRLAARRGTRLPNGDIELIKAAYTPCPVEDAEGCPRDPSWQIKANKVRYDKARNRVHYDGARVELFGLPLVPLPGLSHTANEEAASGILVPQFRIDRTNGLELAFPYYLRIAPNRDIIVTPHVYANAAPMLEGEYRALTRGGAYRVAAYGTYSARLPVAGETGGRQNDFRGYLEATGKLQLDPLWSVRASGRIATDRTFLRRYDISRDDRLRSTLAMERIGGSSYFTVAGWAVQTLRANDEQGQQPIALPLIDFRQRLRDPLMGGQLELQLNSLSLVRASGQDTQRAFAGVRWDLRRMTPLGQEFTLTALARGDVYHSDENLLTAVPSYRGKSGWQGRGIAAVAADVRWPLIGSIFGGSQILTPRLQIVATPPISNLSVPNEDSRAFELEDSNLFAINRFPGYDRFEDGARATYGIEWQFNRPGLSVNSIIGQSYRLTRKLSLFPDGTGLTDRTSDYVGRTTVAFRDSVRLTHRFRLDKDNLTVRRNEIDALFGNRKTYALIGYLRLNRDITSLALDLQDREEVRVGGRIGLARNWSIFGSAIVDLSGRASDPVNLPDGFEPVRHRLGIAYEDECVTFGLTWRRDYEDTGDAKRGNSYLLRLSFRNLGF